MPRNEETSSRPPTHAGTAQFGSADHYIARLVGEMVESVGGQVREPDGELTTIERQLAALREEEAKVTAARQEPAAVVALAPVVSLSERQADKPTLSREGTGGAIVRRRLSDEERLTALRALSDDLSEAENEARRGRQQVAGSPPTEMQLPAPRSAESKRGHSSPDAVIVDALTAGIPAAKYIPGPQRQRMERRSGWLTAVLTLAIIGLSGLLALSWFSPTGTRGLVDGSAWRSLAFLGQPDRRAEQTSATTEVVAAADGFIQAAAPSDLGATSTPAVEPLSHGLRVVKTYRVGPDGRVLIPEADSSAQIPSRQALAEHSAKY